MSGEEAVQISRIPDDIFLNLKQEHIAKGYDLIISGQKFKKETIENFWITVAIKLIERKVTRGMLSEVRQVGEPGTYEDTTVIYCMGDKIISIKRGITYFVEVYEYQEFFNHISRKMDQVVKMYTALTALSPQYALAGKSILHIKALLSEISKHH